MARGWVAIGRAGRGRSRSRVVRARDRAARAPLRGPRHRGAERDHARAGGADRESHTRRHRRRLGRARRLHRRLCSGGAQPGHRARLVEGRSTLRAHRAVTRAGRPQGRLPDLLAQDGSQDAVRGSLPRGRYDRLGPAHRTPPLHRHALSYYERLMRLFDTHAHLHFPDYADDLDAVLERARGAGVRGMVTIGTDRETNGAVVELAKRLPDVWATVGIHPHDAGNAAEADFEAMERLARDESRVVGFGEMGLDFFRNLSPPDDQRKVFRRQIDIARRARKPLVIHCRDAHDETLAILGEERAGETGGVMHCFSGDVEIARRCLDLGFYISLAGPVTYKNARALPAVARFVPEDRLVVETDCPYLPPTPHRGKRNEPAYVALTATRVAELRGADPD